MRRSAYRQTPRQKTSLVALLQELICPRADAAPFELHVSGYESFARRQVDRTFQNGFQAMAQRPMRGWRLTPWLYSCGQSGHLFGEAPRQLRRMGLRGPDGVPFNGAPPRVGDRTVWELSPPTVGAWAAKSARTPEMIVTPLSMPRDQRAIGRVLLGGLTATVRASAAPAAS